MKRTTLCYIEKDDQYLMLHRIKKKNDANRDKWIGIGGHFEEGETPEECVLREVKEETGLTLTSFRLRGLIDFVSDRWEREEMYLFTADGLPMVKPREELPDCDEGCLEWVDKERIIDLNLWEGDNIFLNLLDIRRDYFDLQLVYEGEKLVKAVLDGQKMELFDICDEKGRPTGQTRERKVVHRYGTPHRTAHVWIVRRNCADGTEILLQKRSDRKDAYPGCYDISSAGHIPAGCEPVESAARELWEELGIKADQEELKYIGQVGLEYHGEFYGRPFHDREISHVYLYDKPVETEKLVLQESEVDSVCWMEIGECIRAVQEKSIPNCLIPEELELLAKTFAERGQ